MKVVLKPRKFMGDYFGMNHEAGVELHNKHNPSANTLYIDKTLTKPEQRKVIVHEKIEDYMMKNKHLPYKTAHKVANAFELHVNVKGGNTPKEIKWEKRYQI